MRHSDTRKSDSKKGQSHVSNKIAAPLTNALSHSSRLSKLSQLIYNSHNSIMGLATKMLVCCQRNQNQNEKVYLGVKYKSIFIDIDISRRWSVSLSFLCNADKTGHLTYTEPMKHYIIFYSPWCHPCTHGGSAWPAPDWSLHQTGH